MFRPILHLGLHFIAPGVVSRLLFSDRWKTAWMWMMSAMIIDLDHLLTNPIYDPNRCGINFHPLHSLPAIAVYALLVAIPKTRLVGLGLLIHIILDVPDAPGVLSFRRNVFMVLGKKERQAIFASG